jgi:hypothetical protein
MVGGEDGDARRLEPDLKVFRRRARQLTQFQERRARRGDDDARGPGLDVGHALFADRPRDLQVRAVDARHGRGLRAVEREQGNAAAVLLERDRQRAQLSVRRLRRDVE